jgi:hypothetical protein
MQSLKEEEEDLYEFSPNNPLRGLINLIVKTKLGRADKVR